MKNFTYLLEDSQNKKIFYFLDCIIELIKSDRKLKFLLIVKEEKNIFLDKVNKIIFQRIYMFYIIQIMFTS